MDTTTTITEFTRIYLAVFYSAVAIFYTSRILLRQRRETSQLVHVGPRFTTNWWNHLLFRSFRAAIWMACLFRVFFPGLDAYLGLLPLINQWPLVLLGNLLLTAGFFFSVVAHFRLGKEWRSGIDPKGPANLHTEGFYRFSRNPMYLGIATAQLGFFLALPSAFSALCLLVGLYALRSQTLAEEKHLSNIFAEDYSRYQKAVPRWL